MRLDPGDQIGPRGDRINLAQQPLAARELHLRGKLQRRKALLHGRASDSKAMSRFSTMRGALGAMSMNKSACP
jgi:hypothetical protein